MEQPERLCKDCKAKTERLRSKTELVSQLSAPFVGTALGAVNGQQLGLGTRASDAKTKQKQHFVVVFFVT